MDREALASYIVHGIAKRLNTFILVTGRMGGKYLAKQGMGIKMKKSTNSNSRLLFRGAEVNTKVLSLIGWT